MDLWYTEFIMRFNKEQAKSLSNFFFDVAKGLVLGGIGFTLVVSWEIRMTAIVSSTAMAYACIRIGLSLLEDYR